jgi:hypothetical protein
MFRLHALVRDHARLTLVLLAVVLAAKALVPSGYMLAAGGDRFLTVTICADASGGVKQMKIALADKGHAGGEHDEATVVDQPCTFAGHAHGMLGGADPVLLAAALVFILLIGRAPFPVLPLRNLPFLRPQLRGPPSLSL